MANPNAAQEQQTAEQDSCEPVYTQQNENEAELNAGLTWGQVVSGWTDYKQRAAAARAAAKAVASDR